MCLAMCMAVVPVSGNVRKMCCMGGIQFGVMIRGMFQRHDSGYDSRKCISIAMSGNMLMVFEPGM